ncbi:MAG: TusE/DsrC/DsvC family sulfur relay protein [Chromatiaceae bacterium]|nr:TusE/DsrC/DsvC family sulfur relay protein [Chromatiaceae bacterium]MCP5408644.1 TusE/DsrC/DsvC family sulfur relay protein [Chromatiaceae bacterium]MCP5442608.1 TusE/DsrC/DsvC family sulfur relay protein [Chromatiaceae bacterium]
MTVDLPAERRTGAILGKSALALDEDGFLVDPLLWSEQVGRIIAEMSGIGPLQPEHWAVVYFLRDHYMRLGAIPPMRRICRSSALSRRDMKRLFGNCLEVWRIAGLPNPGEEAKSYMG